jgi:hypothetical protein
MISEEFFRICREVIESDIFKAAIIGGIIGFIFGRLTD